MSNKSLMCVQGSLHCLYECPLFQVPQVNTRPDMDSLDATDPKNRKERKH